MLKLEFWAHFFKENVSDLRNTRVVDIVREWRNTE